MCLILLAHELHPDFPLVLAANRDEFHARPTAPAAPWPDHPDVIGGRDLRSGGSWLAVRRGGRWAAVTNFRDATAAEDAPHSRGALVHDFVVDDGGMPMTAYVDQVLEREHDYAGYNLLLGERGRVVWTSNRRDGGPMYVELDAGVHGLSNHLLNTPWPKVVRGKASLADLVRPPASPDPDRLLDALMDRTYAADHLLPSTGVPADLERALSASFILTPEYGTRCSTAVIQSVDGTIHFAERRFDSRGNVSGEDRFTLEPEPPA